MKLSFFICALLFLNQTNCTETILQESNVEQKTSQSNVEQKTSQSNVEQKTSQSNVENKKKYFANNGVAIKGYDPVAYFEVGSDVKGKKEWSKKWQGVEWRFSSEKNKNLFQANPEKYIPKYGGWCAYAISKGSLVAIDPKAWSIVDGKLYLNYSLSIRKKWLADTKLHIDRANKKYPDLIL